MLGLDAQPHADPVTNAEARSRAIDHFHQHAGTAAGAIFEVVTQGNTFGRNLRARNPRVLWPTYDRYAGKIEAGVGDIVRDAEKAVQGMVG